MQSALSTRKWASERPALYRPHLHRQGPANIPFDFHDPEFSLVGEVYDFTSPDEGGAGCTNCAQQAISHTLATWRVVLTNALITRWKLQLVHTRGAGDDTGPTVLASMQPNDVVPFLASHLHWRVTADTGLVDFADVPSVKVALAVGKADHFADEAKLSNYHDYRSAYQVTAGSRVLWGPRTGYILLSPSGSPMYNRLTGTHAGV